MRNLYLSNRFFFGFGIVAVVFALAYVLPVLYLVGIGAFFTMVALSLVDILLLFGKNIQVTAVRRLPKLFSLSDDNPVALLLTNPAPPPSLDGGGRIASAVPKTGF